MSNSHTALEEASPWIRRFVSAIPKNGVVLDLACGAGRHTHFLLNAGFAVLAVDQNIDAISQEKHPSLEVARMDLEGEIWPLTGKVFSAIVVTNYLYRPYLAELPKMLTDGGVLLYETFAQGNGEFGKPSNPDFLLKTGELLSFSAQNGLKVLAYEDLYIDCPKPAMIQRLCAVKGALQGHIPLQFRA